MPQQIPRATIADVNMIQKPTTEHLMGRNVRVSEEWHRYFYSLMQKRGLRTAIIAGPLLFLLLGFIVAPVLHILWASIQGSKLNFAPYEHLFTEANLKVLLYTLEIGLAVAALSVTAAYPLAYLLTRIGPGALASVTLFLLIPLFTAYLIRTYAWMVILGRQGIVNNALLWLGLIHEPLQLLNTTFAVLLGMTHVFLPMAIFIIYSSIVRIDHNLVRAAQILGAKPIAAFLRVYLPMSLPGIFAAAVLIFISAIGFYITPALLGGPSSTMMSQLIVVQIETLLNFELGYATAIVLLGITVGLLLLASLVIPLELIWGARIEAPNSKTAGSAHIARITQHILAPILSAIEATIHQLTKPLLTRNASWLWCYAILLLTFLTAPLIVVVLLSFSSSAFVVFPPPGLSLRWWSALADATPWHESFFFSVKLALTTAFVATLIGTMGAFWLVRTPLRMKRAIFLLSLSPSMVPVVITATALFIFESKLRILGTFAGLVMGHVLLAVPSVIVIMAAALRNFDQSIERAAEIHGARPLQVLSRISLPILKPAILTATLLAFLTSFDEFLVTMFLIGRQTQTLQMKFWADIQYHMDPLLSSASTFLIGLVVVAIVLTHWFTTRTASGSTPSTDEKRSM